MVLNTKRKIRIGFFTLFVLVGIFIFLSFQILGLRKNKFNIIAEKGKTAQASKRINGQSDLSQNNQARIYSIEGEKKALDNTDNPANDGTIVIHIKNNEGVAVSGIKCQLSIVKKEPAVELTSLAINEADESGYCYFYELKPNSRYWVEFYSDINRVNRQFVEVDDLAPGSRVEKEVVLQDELKNPNNIDPNLNKSKNICFDSDDGANYFVAGETQGVSRCYIDNLAQDCPDGVKTAKDICVQGDYDAKTIGKTPELVEYFCDSDERVSMKGYLCPKGCQKGACKK